MFMETETSMNVAVAAQIANAAPAASVAGAGVKQFISFRIGGEEYAIERPIQSASLSSTTSALMRELIRGSYRQIPGLKWWARRDPGCCAAKNQGTESGRPDARYRDAANGWHDLPGQDHDVRPMPCRGFVMKRRKAQSNVRALEAALSFRGEAAINLQAGLEEKRAEIVAKVKAASKCAFSGGRRKAKRKAPPTLAANYFFDRENCYDPSVDGGVEVVNEILQTMPPDAPRPCHFAYAGKFHRKFAKRLNTVCAIQSLKPAMADVFRRAMRIFGAGEHDLRLVVRGRSTFGSLRQGKGQRRLPSSMCCFMRRRPWENTPIGVIRREWARTEPKAAAMRHNGASTPRSR